MARTLIFYLVGDLNIDFFLIGHQLFSDSHSPTYPTPLTKDYL